MENIDPHNHKESYAKWRNSGAAMRGISEKSRMMILQHLDDMEVGHNVSPVVKRGPRSPGRLRNLKSKLNTIAAIFESELQVDSLIDVENKELEILQLVKRMRDGKVKSRLSNKVFKSVGTYFKAFKSFWHWYERVKRKEGIIVKDITTDIDATDKKPSFNYLTTENVKKLCDNATYEYKVLMTFIFDSGIRSPTELMNVRAKHITFDKKKKCYELDIKEETSKTFGRKIKLLKSGELIAEYIKTKKLESNDLLFTKTPQNMNKYLRTLAYKVLKIGEAEKKQFKTKIKGVIKKDYVVKNGLSLYDFRHSSACFWLSRYKSESALKYRFGWKKSDMIYYYTEFLGMKDTIEEDDLYVDVSKTELEQKLLNETKERQLLEERFSIDLKDMNQKIKNMEKDYLEKAKKEILEQLSNQPGTTITISAKELAKE